MSERRTINGVQPCLIGEPMSEAAQAVEINTDRGDFWLHEDGEHCHVFSAREDDDLDTALHLSQWPSWEAALEAIVEGWECNPPADRCTDCGALNDRGHWACIRCGAGLTDPEYLSRALEGGEVERGQ